MAIAMAAVTWGNAFKKECAKCEKERLLLALFLNVPSLFYLFRYYAYLDCTYYFAIAIGIGLFVEVTAGQ